MKNILYTIILSFLFSSSVFAEESIAWKIDNKYLTPKCFIYEWMSSDNFKEFYNRYVQDNKEWENWWNNIGLYFGNEIPLEDNFEASWGDDTLSLTRYLKDCTSSKPITEDKEEQLSYAVNEIKPKDSCKILAPNINAKCLDIKIINVLQSFPAMSSVINSNIYGIFELTNKNKIILPLKMDYIIEETKEVKTSEEQAEISTINFEWIKKQKEITNTNQLVWEDKFIQLLEYNIPSISLYLGMSKRNKVPLLDNIQAVLGGPPDAIKYFNNRRYVVASACRAHSCPEKGLVFIDTKDKKIIGIIRHFFLNDLDSYSEDGNFLIFSKNHKTFNDIPKIFFEVVKEWGKERELSPKKVRFVGADNKIIDVTKGYGD